jgi:hypothetical protein
VVLSFTHSSDESLGSEGLELCKEREEMPPLRVYLP